MKPIYKSLYREMKRQNHFVITLQLKSIQIEENNKDSINDFEIIKFYKNKIINNAKSDIICKIKFLFKSDNYNHNTYWKLITNIATFFIIYNSKYENCVFIWKTDVKYIWIYI